MKLLEGENVSLRIAEKDDVFLIMGWWGDAQYMGEHQDVMRKTIPESEKNYA